MWSLAEGELSHAEAGGDGVEGRHRDRGDVGVGEQQGETLADLGEREIPGAVVGDKSDEHARRLRNLRAGLSRFQQPPGVRTIRGANPRAACGDQLTGTGCQDSLDPLPLLLDPMRLGGEENAQLHSVVHGCGGDMTRTVDYRKRITAGNQRRLVCVDLPHP